MSGQRQVTVEYDFSAAFGDHVLLTVLNGDLADRFAIPFDQVDAVAEAMIQLAHEEVDAQEHPR